jgi:ABC-type nitrate/sulfonate/bicarbonate transport system substrate-binding protein
MQRREFLGRTTGLCGMAALTSPNPLGGPSRYWSAASDTDAVEVSELRYQGSAYAVTFPELAEDLGYLAPIRLNWVGNTISGPQDIQSVVTRDVDFGGAFNGSIIRLVAAGAKIQAVVGALGSDQQTWAGIYVLQDSPIHQARDLIGAKIGVNTLGAQYEFDIAIYLQRNGASAEEIARVVEVVLPPLNAEQALREKQIDAVVLTGVLRDMALERGGLRLITNEYELYGVLTQASYVLRTDFIRDAPNAARRFVEATARAIDWVQTHPRDEVVKRFSDIILRRGRHENDKLVRYWHSYGVPLRGGLLDDNAFAGFIDWYAKNGSPAIGRLRPQDVYTNALNPFRPQIAEGG